MTSVTQTITWIDLKEEQPAEGQLVVVSGYNLGKKSRGRWIAVAILAGSAFFSDETGEEVAEPTHWHKVEYPASLG